MASNTKRTPRQGRAGAGDWLRRPVDCRDRRSGPTRAAATDPCTGHCACDRDPVQAGWRTRQRREVEADGTISESNLDDDDMDNWLSVAAIEAELKPKIIESFDTIAGTYKRLRRLQDQDIQFQLEPT